MANRLTDIRYRVVRVASPGAGNEIEVTSTGSHFWVVRSMVLTLTTDATVADRHVVLEASDGTTIYFLAGAGSVQAASLTHRYSAYPGADATVTAATVRGIPLDGFGLVIPPGFRLATNTGNLQAGDNYAAVALHVLEAETGPAAPARFMHPPFIEEYDPLFTS